jgi:hypothetical protein
MGHDHKGCAQHESHAEHADGGVERAGESIGASAASQHETFAAVLQSYMSRRSLLKGAMASLVPLGPLHRLRRPEQSERQGILSGAQRDALDVMPR